MENTSDFFMPGPLLFCLKSGRSVCYSVPDNTEEKSDTLAASGNLEDSVTDKIIAEQIIDYINNMPEKKRILLKMRIFEGASYREIADRLGISATCAFDWYHSCIEQIREEFSFEKSSK